MCSVLRGKRAGTRGAWKRKTGVGVGVGVGVGEQGVRVSGVWVNEGMSEQVYVNSERVNGCMRKRGYERTK